MGIGVYFSISSFFIIGILTYIFYSKERVENVETKTYGKILCLTLIGLFLEIATCIWYVFGVSLDSFIYRFASKLTFSYYMLWSGLFVNYLISICNVNATFRKLFNIFNLIFFLLILLLPISYNVDGDIVLPSGPSLILTYLVCMIYSTIDIIICFKYRKKIASSKFTPVYTLLFLGGIDIVLGMFFPSLFLIGYVYALIAIIMYFTIENPDMKLILELTKNRKLTEDNFEDKSNFLFKISQDLKEPLKEITDLSQGIMKNDNVFDNASLINLNSRQLYSYVNNALDVSQIDVKNLKIFDCVYNSKNFFEEINKRVQVEIKNQNKSIEFRFNVSSSIPLYLSGDNTKLKQIILSILFNSIKHTKKGFVELDVNTIIKYGVCRLLIEVSDCGEGMSLDKINRVLSVNGDLDKNEIDKINSLNIDLPLVHKMIRVLNGNFIIKSEKSQGTSFLVILDQKIEDKNFESLHKESDLSGKLLLISDDDDLSNLIKNKVDSIDVLQSLYLRDALEKIYMRKIKCILVDDKLKEMSAISILKELNTDIPVVIMISEKEKFLGKHYIDDGFKNFIIKEFVDDELSKIKEFI